MEALVEGLMARQHYELAQKLYDLLVRKTAGRRPDFRVLGGLAATPLRNGRTQILLNIANALRGYRETAFVSEGLATWHKTLPFLEDPRFLELADKHRHLLPIPNWHWNLQTVLWATQHASDLEGDFVELGVFKGHTTLFVAEYLNFGSSSRQWWLYDTFSGIPEDQLDPGWEQSNKAAYHGTFSFDEVAARFRDFPNINVIQGRVPEILRERCPDRIAFLHMDLNNASAEIAALDMLFDRLTPGGLIVFDDFCWGTARAQYDAERKWFQSRGLHVLPMPTGQGLFMKK